MTGPFSEGPLPVSVIVICRNAASTLRACLDAVLAQQPAEVIVAWTPIDADVPTRALLDEFQDRVRVLEVLKPGIAVARNTGLAAARAPYIAWCDADDRWRAGKLTQQLKALADAPWSVCQLQKSDSNERVMGWTPSAMLATRAFIDAVGPWDTRFNVAADHDWMVRAKRRCDAALVDTVLVDKGFDGQNTSANRMAYRRELLRWVRLKGNSVEDADARPDDHDDHANRTRSIANKDIANEDIV